MIDMIDIVDQPELDPLDKRVRIDARRWISGHGRGHRSRHPHRGDSRVPWQPDRDQPVGVDENAKVALFR